MKYFLTRPLLFLYVIVIARVPPTQKERDGLAPDQIYIPKFAGRLPPGSESRLRAGVQQGSTYPGHADYTLYNKGFVTNNRSMDHAFGDVRFMGDFLRNAFKINSYWVSSYFMLHNFDQYN